MQYSNLREYQHRAIDFIYEGDGSLLLAEMGSGKTVIAATAAAELIESRNLERVLIVAPLRVCQLVWPAEVHKWDHLDPKDFAYALGSAVQRKEAIERGTPIVVINYENLPWLVKWGLHESFDGIIWDEVTRMKNPMAKRFKAVRQWLKDVKWKVGMTGTFPGNKLEDAFGQLYIVDNGKRLGRTHAKFMQDYFYTVDEHYHMYDPKPGAATEISQRVKDIAFRLESKDYKDQLPSLVTNRVDVVLPAKVRDKYEELKHEATLEELGDEPMAVANVLGKLQQVADGFLYLPREDGQAPRKLEDVLRLHSAKLEALAEIMASATGPVLCVYKHQAELGILRENWPGPCLGGGVSRKDAEQAIADWNAGELPILYVHPGSAGHGLNLQYGGHILVWYGLTWSQDEYAQTEARLLRGGQENTVFVHQLIAVDTVDEIILAALEEKRQVEEVFMANLRGTEMRASRMIP